MQLKPPPAEAVAAFLTQVQRHVADDQHLLLAVSGGPDSLAMLLLANAAMAGRIKAATVDHGLRPEASAEADFVARLCQQMGVAHTVLRPGTPITGSLQASAREARYALLGTCADAADCAWIATAHHADDQLETILMRVARGSGIDGLAAVRARQGRIIRPLLNFDKVALVDICRHCGVDAVTDPSNENPEYDRVAMRQWLAATQHPFDAKRAVATAQSFADAAEALDWATDALAQTRIVRGEIGISIDIENVPIALRRRLLLRVLSEIQPGLFPRGDAVERALAALGKGEKMMLGDVLCEGGVLWRLSLAPPRRAVVAK